MSIENSQKPIRTFIAFNLPDEIKNTIFPFYSLLISPSYKYIKWVEEKNLHITIKFLGNTNIDHLDQIRQIISHIKNNFVFEFILNSFGMFPSEYQPKVLWVSFSGNTETNNYLPSFQQQLENELAGLGFTQEKRKFLPHLTIARIKHLNKEDKISFQQAILKNFIKEFQKAEKKSFIIPKITLFKSTLTPKGSIYDIIYEV